MSKEHVFIWPADGLTEGETTLRETPLEGYFAVRFGRKHLERALGVQLCNGLWHVHIDGFMAAPPNADWKKAFGKIWERADAIGIALLTGRVLDFTQYRRMITTRMADKIRGIDITASVDLNSVETPF